MNTFKTEDYNSPDGMLTTVWGPSLWHTLHTISFNYPIKPTFKQKRQYLNFFKSLKHILPCKYCRDNYTNNLKKLFNSAIKRQKKNKERLIHKTHTIGIKTSKIKSALSTGFKIFFNLSFKFCDICRI